MQTDLSTQSSAGRRLAGRLPNRAAFWLLASIMVTFLAASAVPTPLYATYAAEWGFSSITTTVVFGVYAIAVLATLLTFGRLSDHVGRRPLLVAAVVLQIAATAVFVDAGGVVELLLARVVQGFATGAAAGAVGAGLLDLDTDRGTIVNAIAAPMGTGVGALFAGVLVQYLPAPTHLVFVALFAVFAVQLVGVALMRETVTRAPGALRSLVPEFALPAQARRAMIVATPALVAGWALPSFYASLGPSLMASLSGSRSVLLGSLPLFIVAAGAAVGTVLMRRTRPERSMLLGVATLVLGVATTLGAVTAGSAGLLLVTTLISGLGFGAAFQGGVRTVVPLARAHERAGLLSLVYVVSYLALGVPAILGGLLAVHNADLLGTTREYGLAVIVLALGAAVGLVRTRTSQAPLVVERIGPDDDVAVTTSTPALSGARHLT